MILVGRSRFVVLAALSLLYFLLTASTFNSLGQVLPFMVKDLGLSWTQAGFGFTLLGLACGLASLAPAALIRWIGVALTLAAGAVLLAAGFATFAWTHGPRAYHVGAILLGIGFCCCGPVPAVHILSSRFTHRSRALGAYFTIGGLGAVAGPLFVYAMDQEHGGWRAYWLACAAASLALGGFAALVTRDPAPVARGEAGGAAGGDEWTLRAALAAPQLWIVIAAYTGCLLVNTTVHSFAFQHLIERGQSQAIATGLISISALIGAGGSALAGVLGERVDGRRLTMLALAMLGLAATGLAVGRGWPSLGLFVVGLGVGLGVSYVGTAMLLQDYFGRLAARLELYSVMTVVSTSAALGPALGGVVRDRTGSFGGVFLTSAAIALALLAIVAATRRPHPARRLATSGS